MSMPAQSCPIMCPVKNKSETKFGEHALANIVVGCAVTMT